MTTTSIDESLVYETLEFLLQASRAIGRQAVQIESCSHRKDLLLRTMCLL
ncbi:hypothetical protein [Rubripirellula obstinata]|nr:hypothetical protein [Rubripirellula obstinata]